MSVRADGGVLCITSNPLRQCIDGAGARDVVGACDSRAKADDDLWPQGLEHLEPSLGAYDFQYAAHALVLTALKGGIKHRVDLRATGNRY